MSVEADVLVVGAGPAGSATATHLARIQSGAAPVMELEAEAF